MSTLTAGAVLQARYARYRPNQSNDNTSIESTAGKPTDNTSIELPAEIKGLITGTDYWVNLKTLRYKKHIREGHLDKLRHLARAAQTKGTPANWFAAACSKKRWEKYTLPYFTKLKEVAQKAEAVAHRLGTPIDRVISKQIINGGTSER